MTVETCRALSQHPRILGLKDATGNLGFSARVSEACGTRLPLYAGNDDIAVPLLSMGGLGVISVVSNLLPQLMTDLCRLWWEGKTQEAADIQRRILPLCDVLFSEVNPIPVKTAMCLCGMCEAEVRLPLSPGDESLKKKLFHLLPSYGLSVKKC